jgi:hypothetical protein
MTTLELVQALSDLGITEGFSIRDGLIVVWDNETQVPESLTEYLKLDVND